MSSIGVQRLHAQQLVQPTCLTPSAVVAWLGAVQAQDYAGAKWSLGLRMQQATDAMIEQAFTDGTILRTHVMRPTWHFVTPADIRWLLDLTAPRVKAVLAYNDRHLEIDVALVRRSDAVIAQTLQGGQQWTRAELGSALADAGIPAHGQRLGHLMMHAELDGIVCSGPRRGKQLTYALLDERAPQARRLPRPEALAELTRRYYTSHGPATVQDFAWWSGLPVADAKAGLAMVSSDLIHVVIDGQTYYMATAPLPAAESPEATFLLPTFDELLVGFAGFDVARRGGRIAGTPVMFESPLVMDGNVTGSWRRRVKQGTIMIDVAPFAALPTAQREAITAAAERYGTFIGRPVQCTLLPAITHQG